ncbi:TetR/AcrR family transcriptional regulator [Actinomadura gamaensis]|uniref:TetR/AcrR family transcriptional regulator n=1 Tax=Actinomadura gamaensis TaxID=1763541 RepID=A0ABV9TR97_9ACTN
MPRVSEEHLERRRRQIVDAARACFIRKGLHETSMQDIFAESGLSAGAVYRYFKSKNEIVDEIVSSTRGDLLSVLSDLVHAEPLLAPDEVCRAACEHIRDLASGNGPVRLAAQAWAMAAHDEHVGAHVRETMVGVRDLWSAYARRLAAAGRLPADVDAEAAGQVLFGLFPGFILQYVLLGDATPETLARGVRALFPAPAPVTRG